MIKAEVPEFRQLEYTDVATGKTMMYNLFTPKDMEEGKTYPLILFMADASTPGTDVTRPSHKVTAHSYGLQMNGRVRIRATYSCPNTQA